MARKDERQWMSAISRIGCIVCYLAGHPGTPGEVHHILRGGRRISHLHTICLCSPGHHRNGDNKVKISRHPFKLRFESTYGTEEALLQKTKGLVVALAAQRLAA